MFDIVIIGAGPVGLFSGFYAGMRGMKGAIIESSSRPGGQLNLYAQKEIRDIPGFSAISAQQFLDQLYRQYQPYQEQIPLYLNEQITDVIHREDNTFMLVTDKRRIETKVILVASGTGRFLPRKLEVPGAEQATNIVYAVKDLEVYRNKEVAILGGGDSALDWALAIEPIARKTYLIHRRNEFRGHEESILKLKKSQVTILTPYIVSQVSKQNSFTMLGVCNLDDGTEKTLVTDHIIVNYGTIPSGLGALAKLNLSLSKTSAIAINTDCSTNVTGVYAVGNAVDYLGKVTTIACGMGEVPIAINAIHRYLNPGKNLPFVYSSMKK